MDGNVFEEIMTENFPHLKKETSITQVSRIAGRHFNLWATREAQSKHKVLNKINPKEHTKVYHN